MKRDSGVALITVLLVVALAATVCAALVTRQQLAIRSTANQLHARQAWQYVRGGEQLAIALLDADRRSGASTDHRGEVWAQRLPAYPVDGGQVQVAIEDLSGRFNLNSVIHEGQVEGDAFARLQRLLVLLQLDSQLAWQLVAWMAPDATPDVIRMQAERSYRSRTPMYRAAARPLADVSELRLLAGIDDASYQRLLPHVTALPASTPLNVNTADPWVLASLADGLGLHDGRRLSDARGTAGFRSVDAFLAQPLLHRHRVSGNGLSVRSQWFSATSDAAIGERHLHLISVLQRDGASLCVVSRQLASPYLSENDR
ncbi:putative type II secretion system protein K [compost metagenome]